MYADDNRENLVPNHDGGVTDFGLSWVPGWLDFVANNTANTNLNYLRLAKIGPYTKNVGIYKCPADIYLCIERGAQMARVRSVGMNGFIEGGAYKGEHKSGDSHWYSGWWSYDKMSDIKNPAAPRAAKLLPSAPRAGTSAGLVGRGRGVWHNCGVPREGRHKCAHHAAIRHGGGVLIPVSPAPTASSITKKLA